VLTREERRTTGSAALLAIVVEETKPFLCEAVDVGRLVTHDAVAIAAQIRDADIIAEDDENVGLSGPLLR
jgi:hypothetical protein